MSDRERTKPSLFSKEGLREASIKATALFTLGGAAFNLTACSPETKAIEEPTPTMSAPVVPGATETPAPTASGSPSETGNATTPNVEQLKTKEELITELEINAGLSPEDYARQVTQRINEWNLAGASEDLYNNTIGNLSAGSDQILDTVNKVASEQAEIFSDALFVGDWRNHDNLLTVNKNVADINADGLYQWVCNHNTEGKEDFKVWTDIVNVTSVQHSETNRTITIEAVYRNNHDKIGIDKIGSEESNGRNFTWVIDTTTVDGKEKITKLESSF